jgi:MFS family permease
MKEDILQVIEKELASKPSLEEMKLLLLGKGFSESDVDRALLRNVERFSAPAGDASKRNARLFTTKEVLDRIGYGCATHQFVNILFYQTLVGAGLGGVALLLVGLFNGLKGLFSTILSTILQEFNKVRPVSKKIIGYGGILFGFSFLFMALARSQYSVELFAVALLLGSIGVVSYGDLYNQLVHDTLKKERMGAFLARISQYGVLITAVSIVFAGWLMDTLPDTGKTITLFGGSFRVYGYLIAFEITAMTFILSGYIISRIKEKRRENILSVTKGFLRAYFHRLKEQRKLLLSNKIVFLLLFASVLAGVAQALGNSFYGIFIFEEFKGVLFGGFLNVAVIFAVAVIVSLLGPWLASRLERHIGYSPMLVFGTLLIAMTPLFMGWSPNIYAIGVGVSLSIIGAAMVGVAQGLLARKILKEEERTAYFASLAFMIAIPFLFLLPFGAWVAQTYGLTVIFKVITFALLAIVVPVYIVLVAFANKRRL